MKRSHGHYVHVGKTACLGHDRNVHFVFVKHVVSQNRGYRFQKTRPLQNDIGDVPEPGHVVRWIGLGKLVRTLLFLVPETSVRIFYDEIGFVMDFGGGRLNIPCLFPGRLGVL